MSSMEMKTGIWIPAENPFYKNSNKVSMKKGKVYSVANSLFHAKSNGQDFNFCI